MAPWLSPGKEAEGWRGWGAVGARDERGRDSSAEPPTVLCGEVPRVALLPAAWPCEARTIVGLPCKRMKESPCRFKSQQDCLPREPV